MLNTAGRDTRTPKAVDPVVDQQYLQAHFDRLAIINKPFPPIRLTSTLPYSYLWGGCGVEKPWRMYVSDTE